MSAAEKYLAFLNDINTYEIPKSADVLSILRKGPAENSGVISKMRKLLDRYHAFPLTRSNLAVKSVCLNMLQRESFRRKLKQSSHLHQDALVVFLEHVERRMSFLDKLVQYDQAVSPKISKLVDVVRTKQERVKPVRAGDKLTVGLHWSKILEKLDPYHRETAGEKDVCKRFNKWVTTGWNDRLSSAQNIVNFFLSDFYTKFRDSKVVYYDKLMRRLSRLKFPRGTGKVYAYYAQSREDNTVKYDRFTIDDAKQGKIVWQQPFHTTGGQIQDGNETVRYGYLHMRDEGIDLFGAQIYVMQNDRFYTYKARAAKHSMATAGEAVQTAGMIVAEAGKILAIDNKSGHYRPSWKHLKEAVDLLHSKKVFHRQACVGVSHGEGCVFFKLDDFRDLATRSFPLQPTLDAINRGYAHVFRGQMFQRVRRLYESEVGGDRVWSWEKAKEEFLDLLYPKARVHMAALESLHNRHRAFYAKEFKQRSKHWFAPRWGRTLTVDQMLKAFDRAHDNYRSLWNSFEPTVGDFRAAVRALEDALQELDKAVKDWQDHRAMSLSVRERAIDELAEQTKQDAAIIARVKDWIEDMAKRDLSHGYLAEWS